MRIAWRDGDVDATEAAAQAVLDDARRRGSARPGAQAELLVLLARGVARRRRRPRAGSSGCSRHHDQVAGLEAWRATAEAAAVTGEATLADAARRRATLLLDRAGDHAPSLGRWIDAELSRLGVG